MAKRDSPHDESLFYPSRPSGTLPKSANEIFYAYKIFNADLGRAGEGSLHQIPQHCMENAAIAVVIHLHGDIQLRPARLNSRESVG